MTSAANAASKKRKAELEDDAFAQEMDAHLRAHAVRVYNDFVRTFHRRSSVCSVTLTVKNV